MKLKFTCLIMFVILLYPSVSLAARLAPGSVPQLAPLQPIPQQTAPNLQNNVYSQNENANSEQIQKNEKIINNSSTPHTSPSSSSSSASLNNLSNPARTGGDWWLLIVMAIVVFGIGYFTHRKFISRK